MLRIEMFMPGLTAGALGAGVHLDFAAAVGSLGHEFRIVTTASTPVVEARRLGQVLPLSRTFRALDAVAAPLLRTRSLLSPAAAFARHLRAAGRTCDLVHVEVAYPFGVAATIGAIASGWSGPIVITPMGEDTLMLPDAGYGFRRYLLPRRAVMWALSRASGLRCISPLHEKAIAELAPATPRRIIPLNVSDAVVNASRESADVRAARRAGARRAIEDELKLGGRPVVLSLGRLHPFKGLDVLVGAMRRVPDAVLIIAGPSLTVRPTGDERARLSRLVGRWNLGDRVRFLGGVSGEQAMRLLAAADVVAVPSRLESLNKVCVEATAVGTPFVVTESTGISAWAREANIGVVVSPGDEDALAGGLCAALEHPALASDRVTSFVRQFSSLTVAQAVVDFYRDVTGKA